MFVRKPFDNSPQSSEKVRIPQNTQKCQKTHKQLTRLVGLKRLHFCELNNLSSLTELLLSCLSCVIGPLQIVQSAGAMLAVFASILRH